MKQIYLSGPMTGLPEHNFPAFYEAERIIREAFPDAAVKNPARNFDGLKGLSRDVYLREDLRCLSRCDGIVMLPGWAESKGARMESLIARELGLMRWMLTVVHTPDLTKRTARCAFCADERLSSATLALFKHSPETSHDKDIRGAIEQRLREIKEKKSG